MPEIGFLVLPSTGQDRLESLLRYFQNAPARPEGNQFWTVLVLLAALVALVGMVSQWLLAILRKKNRPRSLFLALCRSHKLSWRQCWVLWQLAQMRTAQMPARVFLDPDLFDLDQLPSHWSKKALLLANLRSRLFGELAPAKKLFDAPKAPADCATEDQMNVSSQTSLEFPTVASGNLEWPSWHQANPLHVPKLSEAVPRLPEKG